MKEGKMILINEAELLWNDIPDNIREVITGCGSIAGVCFTKDV